MRIVVYRMLYVSRRYTMCFLIAWKAYTLHSLHELPFVPLLPSKPKSVCYGPSQLNILERLLYDAPGIWLVVQTHSRKGHRPKHAPVEN